MNIRILYGFAGSAIAFAGTLIAFKPEKVFSEDYSFLQYSLSVFGIAFIILGILMVFLIVLSVLPGVDESLSEIKAIVELDFKKIPRKLATYGAIPILLFSLSGIFFGYHFYKLARNSYSFSRDVLFPQYQNEIISRIHIDINHGNIYPAKQTLKDFSARFKGTQNAADAEEQANSLEKMLLIKNSLLKKSRDLEKIFGINRISFQMKAEALQMHPWDANLQSNLQADLNTVINNYLPLLVEDSKLCSSNRLFGDKVRLGRHFVLLGYEKANEINIKNAPDFVERFCQFTFGSTDVEVQKLVEKVWQIKRVKELVEKSRQENLQLERRMAFEGLQMNNAKSRFIYGNSDAEEMTLPAEIEESSSVNWSQSPPLPPTMIKLDD